MLHLPWLKAVLCLSLIYLYSVVSAQSSTSGQADGLTTGAGSKTISSATATIDGSPTTYSVAFTVPAEADVGPNILPTIDDPKAKQAQDICPGYIASNVRKSAAGVTASLSLAGEPCNAYGTDIEDLSFSFEVQSDHRMNIRIEPAYLDSSNSSQYLLSPDLIYQPASGGVSNYTNSSQGIDLEFTWSNDPTFSFTVTRKSTGDVVFDTTGSVLVYENQFIEFVSQLPEKYNLYGMGERIHGLRLGNDFTATFWAADAGDPLDGNIYGNHPFYLDTRYFEVDESGKRTLVTDQDVSATGDYESYSHGMYLRNAHGMEALMLPTNLTWRALGGSIDMYLFDGPTPEEVTKQYQLEAIGLPALQQYWTFGFHQCRWGYKNWTELEDYRDFTNDQDTFPYDEGAAFLERLHANGQHYVPIVDSAIYRPNPNNASDNYTIYDDGASRAVFLTNPDGSEYIGSVWPGYTVFPDWHAEESVPWWTDSMLNHYSNVAWDGIWIDMSEVSSFCLGSCGSGNLSLNPVHPPFALPGEPGAIIYDYPEGFENTNASEAKTASSLAASQASAAATAGSSSTIPYFTPTITPGVRNVDNPPYVLNNVNGALGVHAVAPNATHIDGVEEYDVHNLFGYQILDATYQALLAVFPGKRPFIIGRSTFAGSGKHAGHWGGDNTSLWAYMYFSISQALNFGLFGIPMFGVDTCGFNGNSDEELCNRWMQLSAFFPFYRNHNTLSANSQEAYVWASVAEASKTAMAIRYSLLPYMYTLFYQAHTTGSTVMRALSWEFTIDPTLAAVDNQFLLGPSVMVIPALGQGMTEVKGVFPGVAQGDIWYDWYSQEAMDVQPGVNTTIPAPLGHIPVYVRGGSVLPQQEPLYTTTLSRSSPWSLLCALDGDGAATGALYVDDGESVEPVSSLLVEIAAAENTLRATVAGDYADTNPLANVTILGVTGEPSSVTLNGQDISDAADYDGSSKVLRLTGLETSTSSGAWAQDWTLTWS